MSKNMNWLLSTLTVIVVITLGVTGYKAYQQKQLKENAEKALQMSLDSTNNDFLDDDVLPHRQKFTKQNVDAKVYLNLNDPDKKTFFVEITYPIVDRVKTPFNDDTEKIKKGAKIVFKKQTTVDNVALDSKAVSPANDAPIQGKVIYQVNNL
ncbi:hypothetical protein D3P96_03690 [Weissella viridescens]|uniref:Uncharacterized protein n=1 Tax=Weissella viridescens TaxID=1629 RepID=A0A3P2RLQ4_WEIVI|nr:hypothetical protein [Weissella viridescens]RRG18398.1 hypothetical protein D3P96_03690 [Weissella viridescens]